MWLAGPCRPESSHTQGHTFEISFRLRRAAMMAASFIRFCKSAPAKRQKPHSVSCNVHRRTVSRLVHKVLHVDCNYQRWKESCRSEKHDIPHDTIDTTQFACSRFLITGNTSNTQEDCFLT